MNTEIPIDNLFLGADTVIRPEVLALLNAATKRRGGNDPAFDHPRGSLDEYEQAMVS